MNKLKAFLSRGRKIECFSKVICK